MVLPGHFLLSGLVAMTMRIEIPRGVSGMVMVLPGYLLRDLVAMAVLIHVPRLMAGVVVMLTWLFLRHLLLLGSNAKAPLAS